MIEPRTKAGRAVLEEWEDEGGADQRMRDAILAIEVEAAAVAEVASSDRADALLRALVADPRSHATDDWPFDYEQGLCFWCGTFLNSGDGHNDGCAFAAARRYLDAK